MSCYKVGPQLILQLEALGRCQVPPHLPVNVLLVPGPGLGARGEEQPLSSTHSSRPQPPILSDPLSRGEKLGAGNEARGSAAQRTAPPLITGTRGRGHTTLLPGQAACP